MPKAMGSNHGAMSMGLGSKQVNPGVTGPGGKFSSTKNPQDISRKVSNYSGENSGPSVPKNIGISQRKTGGMNRKFAGVVGPTKGSGTK